MKYNLIITKSLDQCFFIHSLDTYEANGEDIVTMTELLSEPAVKEFLTDGSLEKYKLNDAAQMAEEFLTTSAKRWIDKEDYRFIIRDSENKIIGVVGIDLHNKGNIGEIWFYKSDQAASFMFEALCTTIPLFNNEGLEKIIATVNNRNRKSYNLLEKLGFIEVGIDKDDLILELTANGRK